MQSPAYSFPLTFYRPERARGGVSPSGKERP
jgi:hypothetical protein